MESDPGIRQEAYQRSDHGTTARAQLSNRSHRLLRGLAYCVVHASALYAFLTFAIATDGLEFFYFYPRDAHTLLQPFSLSAMMWLGTAIFSLFGLVVIGFRDVSSLKRENVWRRVSLVLGVSVLLILFMALGSPNVVPFWWVATIALGICWFGFGSGLADIVGGRRELLESFFASLFAVAALLETWSLSNWLVSGTVHAAPFANAGADLEMNLTYATSVVSQWVIVAAWLSPLWGYVAFRLFRTMKKDKPADIGTSDSAKTQRMKLELDDFILATALVLICVLVGFYAYFQDPPWLVGTDAYWRYNDPLERVMNSGNALAAASSERHSMYLLVLYGIHLLTGLSPFNLVKASPVALAMLLSLLTYFGVVRYRSSRTEGFFAAFFSATTFPTTLGIFASPDANWLAMVVTVGIMFVLVSIGQSSRDVVPKALLATFCGVLLLLLHPWMWGIAALTTLFAGFVFLIRRNWRMSGAMLIVALCGLVAGVLAFSFGSQAERRLIREALGTFTAPLASQSLVLSPFGVIGDSFRIWASFLNPLLSILVVIGALLLVGEKPSSYKTLVLSWMLVTGIGTLFAVTLQTEIWRIWYVQPLWLLAGVGMNGLLHIARASSRASRSNSAAIVAVIIPLAGLGVFILQPILGSGVFYLVAMLPALFSLRRSSKTNSYTLLATLFMLFVSLFFLNHTLRSLYPLILNPHNFIEH